MPSKTTQAITVTSIGAAITAAALLSQPAPDTPDTHDAPAPNAVDATPNLEVRWESERQKLLHESSVEPYLIQTASAASANWMSPYAEVARVAVAQNGDEPEQITLAETMVERTVLAREAKQQRAEMIALLQSIDGKLTDLSAGGGSGGGLTPEQSQALIDAIGGIGESMNSVRDTLDQAFGPHTVPQE